MQPLYENIKYIPCYIKCAFKSVQELQKWFFKLSKKEDEIHVYLTRLVWGLGFIESRVQKKSGPTICV